MARGAWITKRSRVASMLRRELHRAERAGVLVALQCGLAEVRERFGFHSEEARATERAIKLLEDT